MSTTTKRRAREREQTKAVLWEIHRLMAEQFLEAIRSGQANAAMMEVARKFLKDQGLNREAAREEAVERTLEQVVADLDEFECADVLPFGR
jgi:urease gamma subunit